MRRKKHIRTAKYWHDMMIPARLFFEILEDDKVYRLIYQEYDGKTLSKPKTKDLERAWAKIFDEYFRIKNDPKLKLILKTKREIIKWYRRIAIGEFVLLNVATKPLTDQMRKDVFEKLKKLQIYINPENDTLEEIKKALTITIAGFKNRMELEKDNLNNLTKGVKSSFEEDCVSMEDFGFKIDENVSLGRFLQYEKSCIKKAKNGRRVIS